MTNLVELIKKHFNSLEPFIEDFTNTCYWRYSSKEDRVYYWLREDSQVMSTLNKEPVYRGDEIFAEKNPGQRIEIENYVIFTENDDCFYVFLKESELKTKAWWLYNHGKYNYNWATAEWIEI